MPARLDSRPPCGILWTGDTVHDPLVCCHDVRSGVRGVSQSFSPRLRARALPRRRRRRDVRRRPGPCHPRPSRCRWWPITPRFPPWRTMRSRRPPARRYRDAAGATVRCGPRPSPNAGDSVCTWSSIRAARSAPHGSCRPWWAIPRPDPWGSWVTSRPAGGTHHRRVPAWPCSPRRGSGSSSPPQTRRC